MVFHDWQSLLESGDKKAATIINCTMDRFHFESTMKMLQLGYDVLLEKPMTPILEENVRLTRQAEATGRVLANLPCAALHAILADLATGG